MSDFALVVFGAIVGALATGGIGAWEGLAERRTETRVAARVVLGDLYVLEGTCELIRKHSAWPDRVDHLAPMVEAWREHRAAFARGSKAWEWALVDGLYSNLDRTVPMVRPGAACTAGDLDVIGSLLAQIPRAREVVLERRP